MNEENLTKRGRGRPKGSPNKLSKEAKDVIASVAQSIGGAERLQTWVQADPKNESAYWTTIYPKLLPLTLTGSGDDGEHTIMLGWLK